MTNVDRNRRAIRELRHDAGPGARDQFKAWRKRLLIFATRGVIQGTPRDTGNTAGNWRVNAGSPSSEAPSKGRSPQQAINEAVAVADRTIFEDVFISNNAPAAPILEHGGFVPKNPGPSKDPRPGRLGRILVRDGYSVQAPRGILSNVVAAVERRFSNARA